MTSPERTPAERPTDATEQGGEVLISGLDTGPSNAERGTPTPSELEERLLPLHPVAEPDDEDG
ncbi:hypothetical protein E7T09_01840 [Deinococcus sp. KSM4-11]|uniref:hypothetical protein n=1 Tax=Deinococcus sp. KSM4-11 TaxID=2568654 RepID=UPI0010A5835F|nr:hypothetical protein [Deinococcus sp. KSM4-11]THF87989.1 hypothetical protein E7T09_01840 [Deinococcus sp. KSM4-11]